MERTNVLQFTSSLSEIRPQILHKFEACVQRDTCMYHVAWRNKHLQTIGVVTWFGRSEHCLLLIKYNTCRDV
jgi:hypothetical protein